MTNEEEKPDKSLSWLGTGAVLAAIGASACCVLPLLLLSLGIGGAWMSTLTSMTAIRPFLFALTLLLIWVAFMKLYLSEENCEEGAMCVNPKVLRNQRLIFWIVSIVIVSLLAFPWYAPWLMG
ncbi:MAG: mercuric transporter MerT family protein [Methylococcales bacterium]|nr:mercuric transporter MerT family protein [Methylococcales bacterium]